MPAAEKQNLQGPLCQDLQRCEKNFRDESHQGLQKYFSQLQVSNIMFLGCVEERCDTSLQSNLPASVTAGDSDCFCLLRDHDTYYEKRSCGINILLATQNGIKPPHFVSLNASQTECNSAAIFSQTYFKPHSLSDTDNPLKNTKKFKNCLQLNPLTCQD